MFHNTLPRFAAAGAAACALAVAANGGVTNPTVEEFDAGNANWIDGFNAPAGWSASGGPDGAGDAFISSVFNFSNSLEGDQVATFRGLDANDASGDAFVGDWLANGVTEFSFYVRHDFTAPLNFFARIATPGNFPAAIGLDFTPVFPNTWTQITIDISESNPLIILEGGPGTFDAVFNNVGNLQLGLEVPAGLAGFGNDVTFDLDGVAITPAPGALAVFLLAGVAGRRRRRRDLPAS
ncbi:MAG: PEP-CTERM sorting domain-containing protein [Planctomycetota bacterium]|jgi:MYXO-CTERM domain-containing protein